MSDILRVKLQYKISTINSNLKIKSNSYFIKYGNVVEFTLITHPGGNVSVPEGYRPYGIRHFLFYDSNSNKEVDIYYNYNTHEMVIPKNVTLYGTVTYIAD